MFQFAHYIFDWGDTLMVDYPDMSGKMCDWEWVQAVEGAEDALRCISKNARIYVATGASESTEMEIKAALKRVGLDTFISGYFCKSNLGIEKGDPAFFSCILKKLGKHPHQVTMVGDSLSKDIEPALALGMKVIWFCRGNPDPPGDSIRVISSLEALCV